MKIDNNWLQLNGLYKCPHCNIEKTKKGIISHIIFKHTEAGKNRASNFINYNKKNVVWNKGLTKEDPRVLKYSISISKSQKGRKGRKQSEETKKKLSKCGGYKPRSGRGKSGWFKNYWCQSSWELAFVIYNIDHNIKFKRNNLGFQYTFKEKNLKYYPDFILGDTYIEIKGFKTDKDVSKWEQFQGKLKILYKNDLIDVLSYVENKYGKNFINLYENRIVSTHPDKV